MKTASLSKLVAIVANNNGITAGHAGFELWGEDHSGRPENICGTMYCRTAGRLLKQASVLGLVRTEQHGPARFWFATEKGRSEIQ